MTRKITLTIWKVFAIVVINLLVATIVFFIVEGFSSTVYIAKEAFWDRLFVAERRHTQYDEELGWVNLPNVYIKDMYGPGKFFRTNSQLFRNNKNFSMSVPHGKIRIICSGDSLTMSYGVDNDNAWCQLLVSINDRIESINMGQGGYGVDQAYLWYKRNSTKFDHDVHIFAFISSDFGRMENNTFSGYGKPVLELRNGVLINTNRPVPKRSYYMPRLPQIQNALRNLSSIKLLTAIFERLGGSPPFAREDNQQDNRTREIALKIFQNLQQINQAKKSILVLVLLPTEADYRTNESEPWRKFLHTETAKNGWLFIDVIEELRKYPPQEVGTLFKGHYSEKGNAYIAGTLYKKLVAIPEISYKLKR